MKRRGGQGIEDHHDPEGGGVIPHSPVEEGRLFENIPAIPGDKEFHAIRVEDEAACQKQQLCHGVEVPVGKVYL